MKRPATPYFKPNELPKFGHSIHRLRQLVRSGEAERVSRGLYRWTRLPATTHDSLAMVAKAIPGAAICLLSALRFHDIGTQDPHAVWIAIRRSGWRPSNTGVAVRIVHFRAKGMDLGISTHHVDGLALRVTDPARSIVDCFRLRNRIGLDIGLEALGDALRRKKVTIDALISMAREFRVEKIMRPYIEARSA